MDAITYDEYGICVIDEKKCIQCGACIHSCPFGAIGSKTFMVDVIRLINAGKKVVAMLAPATEGPVSYTHLDVYKRQGQDVRLFSQEDSG